MRNLRVIQSYFPFLDKGGPAVKVKAISQDLIRKGNQLTVLTANLGFGPREIAAAKVMGASEGWRTDADGAEASDLSSPCKDQNLTVNPGVFRFCRRRLESFDLGHTDGLYYTLGPTGGVLAEV